MYNPFVLFSPVLLNGFLKAGHGFFVRQQYPRGKRNGNKSFLISHYSDPSKAQIHFEALKDDYAYLYKVKDPADLDKLHLAATQPQGFVVYTPLLPESWRPDAQMAEMIRSYISRKLSWKPGRKNSVKTNLFTQFGELFITLKYGPEEVKIPLMDIEKC